LIANSSEKNKTRRRKTAQNYLRMKNNPKSGNSNGGSEKKYINNKQAKPKLFLFNCKPRDDNLVSFLCKNARDERERIM
jgi:hypothetical protein